MQTPQPNPRDAVAYSTTWRIIAAALAATSVVSLLVIAAALRFSSDPPDNPLRLFRLIAAFGVLPWAAHALLRRAFAAAVTFDEGTLVIDQRHMRSEVPVTAVRGIEPWLLPLPGAGLSIRLRSGRRFSLGIQTARPSDWIGALARADDAAPELGRAAAHPSVVYAQAKADVVIRSWRRLAWKFPVFALVPALPLFRVHQLISYGGAFGEYHQYGAFPYAVAFLIYWGSVTVYLSMFAAVLRVPAELVCVVGAVLAPARARDLRRWVERIALGFYLIVVPVVLLLRFAN